MFALVLVAIVLSILPRPAAAANWWQWLGQTGGGRSRPEVSAESYIVVDAKSGQVLLSRRPHEERHPASLTKLMTALLIVENHSDLSQVVPVSEHAASMDPSKMYLYANEHITVENLLRGLLIASANDAAVALSEWAAGSVGAFVDLMNQKARALGFKDTKFYNPMGYEDLRHHSSAYDIAMLSTYVMRQPILREIVNSGVQTVESIDGVFKHSLRPTNKLVGDEDIYGIKTGFTEQSGETLSLYAEREGHPVIVVLLGSTDRFGDGRRLVDWTYEHYSWETLALSLPAFDWTRLFTGQSVVLAQGKRFAYGVAVGR